MDESQLNQALREACERSMSEAGVTRFAVGLLDYETGRRFAINGDQLFHAASTMKVAVLLAICKALDEGTLRGNDTLHVRNRFHSAIDQTPFRLNAQSDGWSELYKSIGRTAKITDLAEWMIVSSSNLATNLLLDHITVAKALKVLQEAGVNGVHLRRGVDDTKAHGQNLDNETTANGLVELFAILRGDFLSKASRDLAINILLKQRFKSMLPAWLPPHASVAHKTGEISTACHDAGIVYVPERQPYILAVLTEFSPENNRAREAIAKISEMVFRRLNEVEATP